MYNIEDIMDYQETLLFVGFLLIMTNIRSIDGCRTGTGRNIPRPSGRNLVSLVYRQHIPNISETTIGASGPAEGRIRRGEKRFNDLVVNYNTMVVFKNEEGTDADRTMTKRCQDRVDTLAILVANEWPNVKLRVTEAWDEYGEHDEGSLHLEGRAVDITTDDRDRTKYGKLARLAVEAGFDWVFYESKYHIHASVIADDSEAVYSGGCFPGESTVVMENGVRRKIADLEVGDRILTTDRITGETKSTDVILFMHKNADTIANYLKITANTESTERQITLTPKHLLFIRERELLDTASWRARAVFAEDVVIGDTVYLKSFTNRNDSKLTEANVTSIETVKKTGVYAPLTEEGTLVVDGVVASSYAVYDNDYISHALFLPLRLLWRMGATWPGIFKTDHFGGIHWYPKYIFNVATTLLPTGILNP